jgi:carboxyl-terminal processing protease
MIQDGDVARVLTTTVWPLGFVLALTPLLLGCFAIRSLRQRARSLAGSRMETIARSMAEQFGIGRRVSMLIDDRASMPMTWGVRHPVILLPAGSEIWPLARLRLVLVHELAHVQRFDCLTQTLVRFLCACYWFHPLVWLAQRRALLEQETACDDAVLNAGLDAEDYAAQLLSISAGRPARFLLSAAAPSMARKRILERRLLAILDTARDRGTPRRPISGMAVAALVAILALFGPMRLSLEPPASARAGGPVPSPSIAQMADAHLLGRTLDEVRAKIRALAVDAPAEHVLLEGALRGMVEAMHDPYSTYLPASDTNETFDPSQTSMVGIGVQVRKNSSGIGVITPLPGSPARRAGLEPGDTILTIGGTPTLGMSIADAVTSIRGPAGSMIHLQVQGSNGRRQLAIERAAVSIPSVQGIRRDRGDSWNYLIDPQEKVGYIQICSFNGGTEAEFQQALTALDRVGLRGLILDLRFCPGGLFSSAAGVAKILLSHGTIVSMRGRDLHDTTVFADGKPLLARQPLIVLINEQTSSGGEVLAGALKDNARAIALGSRTRGKGSVQTILNLGGEKGAIKLTTAQLYLPSGRMIQRVSDAVEWGVDPSDGFYMPLTAKQVLALEGSMRLRQILTQNGSADSRPTEDTADPQLAGAIRAMLAKLNNGEFARVGRPIAEFAVDFQRIQVEQARLKQRLAEIERELEVLSGKEPKST